MWGGAGPPAAWAPSQAPAPPQPHGGGGGGGGGGGVVPLFPAGVVRPPPAAPGAPGRRRPQPLVQEGGPDPALNAPLANVVEQCRARNMPKASIEAALRGAEKAAAAARLLFEARGPGGAALLLEVLTDNPRRSQQAVRLVLARHGGVMADGARHCFERKGVVRVAPRDGGGRPVSLETALEAALEAGAQDVWEDEEEEDEEEPALKFVCEASALQDVRERLAAAGLRPLCAALEYLPRDTVQLPAAALEQATRLLDALGACPDVVRVYDNIR